MRKRPRRRPLEVHQNTLTKKRPKNSTRNVPHGLQPHLHHQKQKNHHKKLRKNVFLILPFTKLSNENLRAKEPPNRNISQEPIRTRIPTSLKSPSKNVKRA